MRTIAVFLLLCGGVFPLAAQNSSDEASIRDLVNRYLAARDGRNASAMAGMLTAEVDQLVSSGEWRKGREEVVKGSLASSEASGGKRTIRVESIRFLSADIALADGRYEIAGGGAGGQDRRMWTTLIVSRTREGWRIAGIRNMLPAAAAR